MNYRPQPIDTSNINLSEDLLSLQEKLAKNAHEEWAQARMNEGWTYGSKRNDEKKEHPCLVSYEDLPDSEKEYDRILALKTLKLIQKLGYKIQNNKFSSRVM